MKLLVLHDEPRPRARAAAIAQAAGWTVVQAESVQDALRPMAAGSVDVVVAGATLLAAGGHLLAPALAAAGDRRPPVLIVSYVTGASFDVRELELPAHDVIREPFDPAELVARIAAARRVGLLTDRMRSQEQDLRELIHTDTLTGLANRQLAAHRLEIEISAARRHGRELALLYIDIDNFKTVNDMLGHATGDDVVREVAATIVERLRHEDLAARWGGDELVVVLPDTDLDAAAHVAEELRAAARRPLAVDVTVSLSIGVAAWMHDDAGELLQRADAALYEAKRSGRDAVRLAPPRRAIAQATREAKTLRVLVVDDMPGIRALLRAYVQGSGIEIVGEAEDGSAAVALAERVRPDVVVMDVYMPEVDGVEATRRLRAAFPGLEIYAFSSDSDPAAEDRMRGAGASAYFHKNEVTRLVEALRRRAGKGGGSRA